MLQNVGMEFIYIGDKYSTIPRHHHYHYSTVHIKEQGLYLIVLKI